MTKRSILVIGDVHFPWANGKSLKSILKIAEERRPNYIIQIGDLYDFFAQSRFPRPITTLNAYEEKEDGRQMAVEMWHYLQKASPDAQCVQLRGNHCERPIKRVRESFRDLEPYLDIDSMFKFKGVKTMPDERTEYQLEDMIFMHGFRKHGDHVKHNQGYNTIVGHSHVGGVFYTRLGEKTVWELNCGYIGSPYAECFHYTKQKLISTWTQGCGFIDAEGPRFIPFKND